MTTLVLGEGATVEEIANIDPSTAQFISATNTAISLSYSGFVLTFTGSFQYDANGELTSNGYVTGLTYTHNGQLVLDVSDFNMSITAALQVSSADALLKSLLTGADSIHGGGMEELLNGYEGNDTIFGGAGDDSINGGPGINYLRGDEGNDTIYGGADFDDINGNMGDDTASGGAGGDWVVGGKDNDLLHGDTGNDIVYGNLGNDTCYGDDGNDIVRGGKDNDVVYGGAGDDWLSGDKGDDTLTGGTGADVFHTFGDAGIDRVTDFNRAEGDRVMVDPGTVYSVAQVGADTVISMDGGGQMILVGVSMSSLTGDWIFGA